MALNACIEHWHKNSQSRRLLSTRPDASADTPPGLQDYIATHGVTPSGRWQNESQLSPRILRRASAATTRRADDRRRRPSCRVFIRPRDGRPRDRAAEMVSIDIEADIASGGVVDFGRR